MTTTPRKSRFEMNFYLCYCFRVWLDVFNEPYVSKPQWRWQRERFNGQNGLMAKTIAVQCACMCMLLS